MVYSLKVRIAACHWVLLELLKNVLNASKQPLQTSLIYSPSATSFQGSIEGEQNDIFFVTNCYDMSPQNVSVLFFVLLMVILITLLQRLCNLFYHGV